LPVGTPGRPGETRNIKYIVIHETGNTGSNANAAAHDSYLHKVSATEPLAWHYTVDATEIYKHLPDNEIGFHAGDKLVKNGGNLNGIGIEMCVNPENDYEQTLLNTAALVRYLMDAYHIPLEDVKKHQDFSGKICPERLIESGRWEEFINLI
ncbi:MAG: N-acetylmuramoyl-L-alanine amidase, partial [Anaerovorax sp.]